MNSPPLELRQREVEALLIERGLIYIRASEVLTLDLIPRINAPGEQRRWLREDVLKFDVVLYLRNRAVHQGQLKPASAQTADASPAACP